MKTIKLNKKELIALNGIRLDLLAKIEEEKELLRDIKTMNIKGLESVEKGIEDLMSLYRKLYFN